MLRWYDGAKQGLFEVSVCDDAVCTVSGSKKLFIATQHALICVTDSGVS